MSEQNKISEKKILRKELKKIRQNISEEERVFRSMALTETIIKKDFYKNSKSMALFISFGTEIGTSFLLNQTTKDGKKIFLPRVEPNSQILSWLEMKKDSKFKVSSYGIPEIIEQEPLSDEEISNIDLVIVPGLGFTENNYRIGYGGGFYDRFFEIAPKTYKVGIGFKEQLVEELPLEPWDAPLDEIVLV